MTDADIVARAAGLLGTKVDNYQYKPKGKPTYKPVFYARVHGIRAIQWMMTLYPMMGERRRVKIRSIVMAWRESKAMPHASRGTRLMATCHPTRVRCGFGLCRKCYMDKYRRGELPKQNISQLRLIK